MGSEYYPNGPLGLPQPIRAPPEIISCARRLCTSFAGARSRPQLGDSGVDEVGLIYIITMVSMLLLKATFIIKIFNINSHIHHHGDDMLNSSSRREDPSWRARVLSAGRVVGPPGHGDRSSAQMGGGPALSIPARQRACATKTREGLPISWTSQVRRMAPHPNSPHERALETGTEEFRYPLST